MNAHVVSVTVRVPWFCFRLALRFYRKAGRFILVWSRFVTIDQILVISDLNEQTQAYYLTCRPQHGISMRKSWTLRSWGTIRGDQRSPKWVTRHPKANFHLLHSHTRMRKEPSIRIEQKFIQGERL